jgi:hypothetical protein
METDWKLLRGQFEWEQYKSNITHLYCTEVVVMSDNTVSCTSTFSDPPSSYPCLVKTVSVRRDEDVCTLCCTQQVFVEVSDASFLITFLIQS